MPLISLESETFQKLQERDLVINVYRDGKWGSFRHLPIQQGMHYILFGQMFSSQVTHYNYQYEGKFENLLYLQKHFNYYFISIL